jgi:hypothetical protein
MLRSRRVALMQARGGHHSEFLSAGKMPVLVLANSDHADR